MPGMQVFLLVLKGVPFSMPMFLWALNNKKRYGVWASEVKPPCIKHTLPQGSGCFCLNSFLIDYMAFVECKQMIGSNEMHLTRLKSCSLLFMGTMQPKVVPMLSDS